MLQVSVEHTLFLKTRNLAWASTPVSYCQKRPGRVTKCASLVCKAKKFRTVRRNGPSRFTSDLRALLPQEELYNKYSLFSSSSLLAIYEGSILQLDIIGRHTWELYIRCSCRQELTGTAAHSQLCRQLVCVGEWSAASQSLFLGTSAGCVVIIFHFFFLFAVGRALLRLLQKGGSPFFLLTSARVETSHRQKKKKCWC